MAPHRRRGAAYWSLLGALQGAAFAGPEAQVEENRLAVAAIAELIADPSPQTGTIDRNAHRRKT